MRKLSLLFVLILIAGCKNNSGDDEDVRGISSNVVPTVFYSDVSGTWLGYYSSSLLGSTGIGFLFTQSANQINGTFLTDYRETGSITGLIDTNDVFNLTITRDAPCFGTFDGSGLVVSDQILIQFTGSDCYGTHTNGVFRLSKN